MELRIGKLDADGTIRHILLECGNEDTIPLLLNFYTRDARLDALLDLGNLEDLGCTPYGAHTGDDDTVHCCAQVRDNGQKKIRNQAEVEDNTADYSKLPGLKLLCVRGAWYALRDMYSERLTQYSTLTVETPAPLQDIRSYVVDTGGRLDWIRQDIRSWADLQSVAHEQQALLYVFRGCKLITTIHPTL